MPACPPSTYEGSAAGSHNLSVYEAGLHPIPAGATGGIAYLDAYTFAGSVSSAATAIVYYDAAGAVVGSGGGANIAHHSDSIGHAATLVWASGATQWNLHTILANSSGVFASAVFQGHISWSGSCDAGVPCQYGTRVRPDQQIVLIITEATIELVLIAVPVLRPFSILFGALVGLTYVPGVACSGPPPDLPVFTADDFIFGNQLNPLSLPKVWQAWQAVNWYLYCECIPSPGGGAPDPIPYTPPDFDPGPSLPPDPAGIVCDQEDLCSTLDLIRRQLVAMAAQVAYLRRDVQLIQRQEVPFAYVRGRRFSDLTGSGLLSVQGILGLSVEFTTVPTYLGSDMDTIAGSSFYLGYLNLGTADGWLRKMRLTHNPQLVLDVPGDITMVEYTFVSGVVADVVELVREP